jgi:flagellar FliL protein
MKKNLLSIIILFLLIINISLTAVMTFSLVVTNQNALSLMTDVATILRLELPTVSLSDTGEYVAPNVDIANVVTYDVAGGESMTIPLKQGPADTSTRYIMVRVALSMDSKNKGFKDNNEGDLKAVDVMIQDRINSAFSHYTSDELKDPAIMEQVKGEIILGLHAMYGSDFIFNVSFRDVRYG